jgi:glutathionylspermidine synthase
VVTVVGTPIRLTDPLSEAQFDSLLRDMIFKGFKWDVQVGDYCTISRRGIVFDSRSAQEIYGMAERLWAELLRVEEWLATSPRMLSRLGLPNRLVQLLKRHRIPSRSPRIARFDFHYTHEGWKVSEVNSDVPGGYIETSFLPQYWPDIPNNCVSSGKPAEVYVLNLLPIIGTGIVGLLHAPWYSEDRQHMEFLKTLLKSHGTEAVVVGPEQVEFKAGKAFAFDKELKVMIRFFPCEWLIHCGNADEWFSPHECAISNPLFAIVSQTKRLPLLWRDLPFDVPEWKKLLPETRDVAFRDFNVFARVLKPCLGRMGGDICIPGVTSNELRSKRLRRIIANRKQWISQQMFHSVNYGSEQEKSFVCLGVYVIDGKANGIYGRISYTGLTDENAADAPVFIESN